MGASSRRSLRQAVHLPELLPLNCVYSNNGAASTRHSRAVTFPTRETRQLCAAQLALSASGTLLDEFYREIENGYQRGYAGEKN